MRPNVCIKVIRMKDNNFQQFSRQRQANMKQGIIEARVNNLDNISDRIKDFIQEKSALTHSPFHQEQFFVIGSHSQSKAKRSLTDWRQLYSKNKNKIIPRHTVYPATADGERIRCSMTGQCNRRKVHSSANRKSSQGEITLKTNSLKYNHSQSKRESLIEFAFAQKCYQKEVLKNQRDSSSKEKKFYNLATFDRKRKNYWKVNEYLSNIADQQRVFDMGVDATLDYLKKNSHQLQKIQFKPYNMARIKEVSKINNLRFLHPSEEERQRSKINLQNGLRYYERA